MQITACGKPQNMTAAGTVVRVGLVPEAISRPKARKSNDLGTAVRMATAVGLEL
ncbi:MAG TPA: hypothetical protein PKH69_02120 [Thiobacillaceae bacterium]|nr:hypothetical protein [Thiobacillaceae bacterium]HNU62882.1 hypothetical protein [Thiobacillaceae bacterium]